MKKNGIFIKIFAYTIVAMLLIVFVTATLFSGQFLTLYRAVEREQILVSYQPLVNRVKNSNYNDIPAAAQRFRDNNQSFEFCIIDDNGGVIYATPGADTSDNFNGDFYYVVHNDKARGYSVVAQTRPGLTAFYNEIIVRALVAFAIVLALCLVCAYVFARQITNPIKRLADDAGKMARLEDVPQSLPIRRDELGDLSRDIHSMYDKLKDTISRLENEILRVREMEEAQRYFFSAASHELKTPIAATSILLEGMLENVGDYKDHPKYLRECVKMMDAQDDVISEILEIVNLSDGKISQDLEKLKLRQIVADILPDFQILAEANGQCIVMDIPDEQNGLVDSKMLQKALSNIILNAVQNTPTGGEIRIWSEPADKQYRLCILNTGARIDDTVLPKLFDPFYRMDKVRGRKSGRSGLGLTIVRKTLEAMNIEYALENVPDGVLFWMDLPKV
ncbi:sensor histidine kinase [Bacillus paranthracis]|uniref:sensor histidine kinase n=1 Tax=Bacillus paranthracis TaxID=2026186 RepID=UPI000D6B3CEE|nr:HAMP domain-containing sensor histidine kinase [Bacillus paranthracis]PWN73282.1 vancomycin resistance histidine kinase VanS [Bacillus cereus]PWN79053.1 vancomycin resistance histidine kinase VanS [Bacillus cereus]UHJ49691.1 HAMP domain-containing histidine kinase [Bacillus paranthracis]